MVALYKRDFISKKITAKYFYVSINKKRGAFLSILRGTWPNLRKTIKESTLCADVFISYLPCVTLLTAKFSEYFDLKNACSKYDCFPRLSLWKYPPTKLGVICLTFFLFYILILKFIFISHILL